MKLTAQQRLLYLRVLALRNVPMAFEPNRRSFVENAADRGPWRASLNANRINALAWRYRRQISPELVPHIGTAEAAP